MNLRSVLTWWLLLVLSVSFCTPASSTEKSDALPVVTSAQVSFYPRAARLAGIDGVVKYHMLEESSCDIDSGTVVLRLPFEVEVSAKGILTCDPGMREQ